MHELRYTFPTKVDEARHYIGGQLQTAEAQIRLAVYGISCQEADRAFEFDSVVKTSRLGEHLDVCHIETLDCVQFTSNFLPTSLDIPSLAPEELAMQFADLVTPELARISSGTHREFLVKLTERSDFQGTVGLHFDLPFLRRISDLQASLGIRLRYLPEPYIRADGECLHCHVNVLKSSP